MDREEFISVMADGLMELGIDPTTADGVRELEKVFADVYDKMGAVVVFQQPFCGVLTESVVTSMTGESAEVSATVRGIGPQGSYTTAREHREIEDKTDPDLLPWGNGLGQVDPGSRTIDLPGWVLGMDLVEPLGDLKRRFSIVSRLVMWKE